MNTAHSFSPASTRYVMTVGHLVSVLRGRWIQVAIGLGIGILLATALTVATKAKYTASASVLVDVKSPDPITGSMMQGLTSPAYMNTQVDLINSEAIARRTTSELRLDQLPEMQATYQKQTKGEVEFETWATDTLSRNLEVTPAKDSNLIRVSYKDSDPKWAAQVANAFVKAYIDTTLELRTEPAKEYKKFFDANAQQLRQQLEVAQGKLSAYQQKNGLTTSSANQVDVETNRLNELSKQLVALQAEASESKSRKAQANTRADQLKESLTSPLLYDLRAELQRSRAKLRQLRATMGERHPQVIELVANISEMEARINEETHRVSGSVLTTDSVNQERLADLKTELEAQRQRVLKLKALNDESQVMQRDVENLQKAYEEVLTRANRMNLESRTGQTNVSVVGVATPPSRPSSPNLVRNLITGLVLGTFAGLIWALVRESRDQRLRMDDEIFLRLNQPLLVTLPAFGKSSSSGMLGLPAPHSKPKRLTAA